MNKKEYVGQWKPTLQLANVLCYKKRAYGSTAISSHAGDLVIQFKYIPFRAYTYILLYQKAHGTIMLKIHIVIDIQVLQTEEFNNMLLAAENNSSLSVVWARVALQGSSTVFTVRCSEKQEENLWDLIASYSTGIVLSSSETISTVSEKKELVQSSKLLGP